MGSDLIEWDVALSGVEYCNVLGRGIMGLDLFGWDVALSGGRVQFLFFAAEGWVGFDSFTILDRDTP